jgi:hypothetical protein
VISHSFAFSASRRLKFSYKSIVSCTAFPSTLVSMLELSPPLPVLLLLHVGGLSRLNTRALAFMAESLQMPVLMMLHWNLYRRSLQQVPADEVRYLPNVC